MPMVDASKVLSYLRTLRAHPLVGPSELFLEYARKVAKQKYRIKPNPMGLRNKKVGGPCTYRPLKDTCTSNCPYAETCYANGGHVALAAKRSTSLLEESLFAVAALLACGERSDVPVRLHVSGDFFLKDELDVEYIEGLALLGHASKHPTKPWAWTYTHAAEELFRPYAKLLRKAGITVLFSDVFKAGGAVVYPFDELASLVPPAGANLFKCPQQINRTPCVVCKVCLTAPENKLCIVFNPHGAWSSQIKEQAKEIAARKLEVNVPRTFVLSSEDTALGMAAP